MLLEFGVLRHPVKIPGFVRIRLQVIDLELRRLKGVLDQLVSVRADSAAGWHLLGVWPLVVLVVPLIAE